MKLLKKINKGFMLTVIVILVLAIYLIGAEAKRKAEKPKIEKLCAEYIELINKYAVMPEKSQKLIDTTNMNNEEIEKAEHDTKKAIDEQMDKLSEELKSKMIDKQIVVDMQKEAVQESIENANDISSSVITNFNKEITKIRKFAFDDDQVTVTFDSKLEVETKYLDTTGEETVKKNSISLRDETITFQNVNGNWKIVYADLQYYSDGYAETTMISF